MFINLVVYSRVWNGCAVQKNISAFTVLTQTYPVCFIENVENKSTVTGLILAIILNHIYYNVFLLTVRLQECLEDTWKLIMSSPTMMYETP